VHPHGYANDCPTFGCLPTFISSSTPAASCSQTEVSWWEYALRYSLKVITFRRHLTFTFKLIDGSMQFCPPPRTQSTYLFIVVVDAGKLYAVVLCCRPVNRHISLTVGGRCTTIAVRDRQAASSSVRWRRTAAVDEAAPLPARVEVRGDSSDGQSTDAVEEASVRGQGALAEVRSPADVGDCRQVLGCCSGQQPARQIVCEKKAK